MDATEKGKLERFLDVLCLRLSPSSARSQHSLGESQFRTQETSQMQLQCLVHNIFTRDIQSLQSPIDYFYFELMRTKLITAHK